MILSDEKTVSQSLNQLYLEMAVHGLFMDKPIKTLASFFKTLVKLLLQLGRFANLIYRFQDATTSKWQTWAWPN